MAHQEHRIPWNTITGHLKLKTFPQGLWPPAYPAVFALNKPQESKDVQHFARCLARVIGEFADTERAKHPERYPVVDSGRLFSRDVIDRSLAWIPGGVIAANEVQQRRVVLQASLPAGQELPPYSPPTTFDQLPKIEAVPWTERDDPSQRLLRDGELLENWIHFAGNEAAFRDSEFNELVILLLAEGEMAALLRLAQHPDVNVARLRTCGYNHQAGYGEVATLATEMYVKLNVLYCVLQSSRDDGGECGSLSTRSLLRETWTYRVTVRDIERLALSRALYMPHVKWMSPGRDAWSGVREGEFDPFMDLERLREHIKECFRIMVRCEVLERELGGGINWEVEALFRLSNSFGLRGHLSNKELSVLTYHRR